MKFNLLHIIIFSVIEVVGLVVWIQFALQHPVYDLLSVIGLVVLFVFLTVEHVVTDNSLHSKPLFSFRNLPLLAILAFSAIDTIIWGVWLELFLNVNIYGDGPVPVVATIFLFVALWFEHTISRNVHERDHLFSDFFDSARSAGIEARFTYHPLSD